MMPVEVNAQWIRDLLPSSLSFAELMARHLRPYYIQKRLHQETSGNKVMEHSNAVEHRTNQ